MTTLWPAHLDELPATGHMGGHWGPELKYAGWDSIIVQGKAATPVWIKIVDDKVTIEDASRLWGNGIYRATAEICTIMGSDAHVAAIGQAGENLCRLSNVMCDRSHSAGGAGSVMGSKNLKAIGVKGTGSLEDRRRQNGMESLDPILPEPDGIQQPDRGAENPSGVGRVFPRQHRSLVGAQRDFTGAPPPRRSRRGSARTSSIRASIVRAP